MLIYVIGKNSYSLLIKFWGSQKLCADIQLEGWRWEVGALNPFTLQRATVYRIEQREWFYSMRFPLLWIIDPTFQPSSAAIHGAALRSSKHASGNRIHPVHSRNCCAPSSLAGSGGHYKVRERHFYLPHANKGVLSVVLIAHPQIYMTPFSDRGLLPLLLAHTSSL